jgi:hypothetical protein
MAGSALPTHDLYNVLGVSRDALPDDIKNAFRSLAKKHHPDLQAQGSDLAAAAKLFRGVSEAYEVLGDAELRRRYDNLNRFAGWTPSANPRGFNPASARPFVYNEADGGKAQRERAERALKFAQRFSSAGSAAAGRRSPSEGLNRGSGGAKFDPNEHIDFAEWNKMYSQFGPGATDDEKAAWAWQKMEEAKLGKSSTVGGGDPSSSHANWEARRTARLAAMGLGPDGLPIPGSPQFAERGASETGQYRAYAERFRRASAADRATSPRLLAAWTMIFLGGYLFATRTNSSQTARK